MMAKVAIRRQRAVRTARGDPLAAKPAPPPTTAGVPGDAEGVNTAGGELESKDGEGEDFSGGELEFGDGEGGDSGGGRNVGAGTSPSACTYCAA